MIDPLGISSIPSYEETLLARFCNKTIKAPYRFFPCCGPTLKRISEEVCERPVDLNLNEQIAIASPIFTCHATKPLHVQSLRYKEYNIGRRLKMDLCVSLDSSLGALLYWQCSTPGINHIEIHIDNDLPYIASSYSSVSVTEDETPIKMFSFPKYLSPPLVGIDRNARYKICRDHIVKNNLLILIEDEQCKLDYNSFPISKTTARANILTDSGEEVINNNWENSIWSAIRTLIPKNKILDKRNDKVLKYLIKYCLSPCASVVSWIIDQPHQYLRAIGWAGPVLRIVICKIYETENFHT